MAARSSHDGMLMKTQQIATHGKFDVAKKDLSLPSPLDRLVFFEHECIALNVQECMRELPIMCR